MDETKTTVPARDLQEGMNILEITGFDSKYSCLDSESLQFLQSKFEGAKATVKRDSGKISVPMDKLVLFDEVTAITDMPQGSALSQVVAGMGKSLEEQGFLNFMITPPPQGPAESAPQQPLKGSVPQVSTDPKHKARIVEAKALLEKVESATESREESCLRIEDMMDQGRIGKFSSRGAMEAVEKILKEDTSSAMTAVAGLKASDQTYAHCVDMSVIFQETYADQMLDSGKKATNEVNQSIMLSGFMHDIGKCKVPKEILESTERFEVDSKEMQIMRSHPVHGAQILSDLGMSKATVNVALCHHVKVDTSLPASYPDLSFDEVLPLTRLAAIVDVYQALIGKRSYKPNWVPGKAVELLMKLRGSEFEEQALGHFLRSIGIYPVGSLVRLSSDELAFVVKNDRESLERPVVVVVETAKGDLLTHHDLFDLVIEPDLSIVEVVDHFKHYDKSEEQAYELFRSISLG